MIRQNFGRAAAGLALALSLCATTASAQAPAITPMKPIVEDARSNLKAGLAKPEVALSNMEMLSTTAPPPGFTNADYHEGQAAPAGQSDPRQGGGPTAGLALANSDLAFSKGRAVMGNFHGFTIYDVANPAQVKLLASVVCPGGQGDVSVHGNLLFMSVEQTRGRLDCGPGGATGDVNAERFRGVRIFDISNLANIRQIAAVQTCRGSHTHTLVPAKGDPKTLYVYNQGTSTVRPAAELAGCVPDADAPNSSLFSIDIIKVPLDAPEKAAVISSPRIFADLTTGAINGLWKGGDYGAGTQKSSVTNQCHDITVYPQMNLAAGACSGNGLILDISDPTQPKRLDAVGDPNFAYWHAALFSNDAKKVVYTDEWGGGTQPRCRMSDPANWGGDIIFDLNNGKLTPRSIYKLPSAQGNTENCVAHNASLIPVPGRDVVVQAWYQGGLSVFDITDSAHPFEIASFDRGPLDATQSFVGGQWSSYWWNGRIYGSEIARGLDILKLKPSAMLSANEIAAAELIQFDEFNPQQQLQFVWPDKPVVARAYLDQLVREKAVTAARAAEIGKALDMVGSAQAKTLAGQLAAEAGKAKGRNVERLQGIARILRG